MQALTHIDDDTDVEHVVDKIVQSATSGVINHDRSVDAAVNEAIRRYARSLFNSGDRQDPEQYYKVLCRHLDRIPRDRFESIMDQARDDAGDEFDKWEAQAVARLHYTAAQQVRERVEDE